MEEREPVGPADGGRSGQQFAGPDRGPTSRLEWLPFRSTPVRPDPKRSRGVRNATRTKQTREPIVQTPSGLCGDTPNRTGGFEIHWPAKSPDRSGPRDLLRVAR